MRHPDGNILRQSPKGENKSGRQAAVEFHLPPASNLRVDRRPITTGYQVNVCPSGRPPPTSPPGMVQSRAERLNPNGESRMYNVKCSEVKFDEGGDRMWDDNANVRMRDGMDDVGRSDGNGQRLYGNRVNVQGNQQSVNGCRRHMVEWFYIGPTDVCQGGEIYITDVFLSQLRCPHASSTSADPSYYADIPGDMIGLCPQPSIRVDRKGLYDRLYTTRGDGVLITVNVVTKERLNYYVENFRVRNGRAPTDLPEAGEMPGGKEMPRLPSAIGNLSELGDERLMQEIPENHRTSTGMAQPLGLCGAMRDKSGRMSPMGLALAQVLVEQRKQNKEIVEAMREMSGSPVPPQLADETQGGRKSVKLRKLPIAQFSGMDYVHNRLVQYQDWAREYVIKAEAEGAEEDQIAEQMVLFLAGAALEAYLGLPKETRKSWVLLNAAMTEKFDPDKSAVAIENLRLLRMGENESPSDFFTQVKRWAKRAHPNIPEEFMGDIWKDSFVNGLPDRMQDVLVLFRCAKMTAEQCVAEVEACDQSQRLVRARASPTPVVSYETTEHPTLGEEYAGHYGCNEYVPMGQDQWGEVEYGEGWYPPAGEGEMRNNSVWGVDRISDCCMAEHLRSDDSPVFVDGCIGGFNCRVMVDSGSAVSIMDADFFRRYFPHSILVAAKGRAKVRGFCGDKGVIGTVNIWVTVAQHQRAVLFQVIPGCEFEALLGRNWFNQIGEITLDTRRGFVRLNGAAPIRIVSDLHRNDVRLRTEDCRVIKKKGRKRGRRKRSGGQLKSEPNVQRDRLGCLAPVDLPVWLDLKKCRSNNFRCAIKVDRVTRGDVGVTRKDIQTPGTTITVTGRTEPMRFGQKRPVDSNVRRRRWSWPNSREIIGGSNHTGADGNGQLVRVGSWV